MNHQAILGPSGLGPFGNGAEAGASSEKAKGLDQVVVGAFSRPSTRDIDAADGGQRTAAEM